MPSDGLLSFLNKFPFPFFFENCLCENYLATLYDNVSFYFLYVWGDILFHMLKSPRIIIITNL